MNIQVVADTLKKTIADKETMLDKLIQRKDVKREFHDEVAYFATKEFLAINIAELKCVLQQVEQCIPTEPEFSEDDDEDDRIMIMMGR